MTNQNNIISRVLPFAVYILFLALGDYLTPLVNSLGLDAKWLYVVKILAVLALLFNFRRDYVELYARPKITHLIYAAIAGLSVLFIWVLPYPAWATLGADVQGFNPVQGQDQIDAFLWISMRIVGAAMIVPLMEELFWRSFLMRWLDSKEFLSISPASVSFFAITSSATLFSLEHHLWLAGLFAGFVYAMLYKIYKNLWLPIFAHAVTNGLLGLWIVITGNWQYW
jgi:uncharacterized protein